MKKYKATNIKWDTDGVETDLPSETIFELEDDHDPAFDGADALSDKYGWCIFSFDYEEVNIHKENA